MLLSNACQRRCHRSTQKYAVIILGALIIPKTSKEKSIIVIRQNMGSILKRPMISSIYNYHLAHSRILNIFANCCFNSRRYFFCYLWGRKIFNASMHGQSQKIIIGQTTRRPFSQKYFPGCSKRTILQRKIWLQEGE